MGWGAEEWVSAAGGGGRTAQPGRPAVGEGCRGGGRGPEVGRWGGWADGEAGGGGEGEEGKMGEGGTRRGTRAGGKEGARAEVWRGPGRRFGTEAGRGGEMGDGMGPGGDGDPAGTGGDGGRRGPGWQGRARGA